MACQDFTQTFCLRYHIRLGNAPISPQFRSIRAEGIDLCTKEGRNLRMISQI